MNSNLFQTPLEKQLNKIVSEKPSTNNNKHHLLKNSSLPNQELTRSIEAVTKKPPQNLKESLTVDSDRPMDFLNQFISLLIEKIIENLHDLVLIDPNSNYQVLLSELEEQTNNVPQACQEMHHKLIDQIASLAYLQKIHAIIDLNEYPVLKKALVLLHADNFKLNPYHYINLKWELVENLLDQEEKEIVNKYHLNLSKLWKEFLLEQD